MSRGFLSCFASRTLDVQELLDVEMVFYGNVEACCHAGTEPKVDDDACAAILFQAIADVGKKPSRRALAGAGWALGTRDSCHLRTDTTADGKICEPRHVINASQGPEEVVGKVKQDHQLIAMHEAKFTARGNLYSLSMHTYADW
jgi:hypothetical protein